MQRIANDFYKRFFSEYLPELQKRSKWVDAKNNLQKNDVVLVMDEDQQRGKWPLGIVEDVELSADNLVRAVTVRCNGKQKRRPVNKLVLLEREA